MTERSGEEGSEWPISFMGGINSCREEIIFIMSISIPSFLNSLTDKHTSTHLPTTPTHTTTHLHTNTPYTHRHTHTQTHSLSPQASPASTLTVVGVRWRTQRLAQDSIGLIITHCSWISWYHELGFKVVLISFEITITMTIKSQYMPTKRLFWGQDEGVVVGVVSKVDLRI